MRRGDEKKERERRREEKQGRKKAKSNPSAIVKQKIQYCWKKWREKNSASEKLVLKIKVSIVLFFLG